MTLRQNAGLAPGRPAKREGSRSTATRKVESERVIRHPIHESRDANTKRETQGRALSCFSFKSVLRCVIPYGNKRNTLLLPAIFHWKLARWRHNNGAAIPVPRTHRQPCCHWCVSIVRMLKRPLRCLCNNLYRPRTEYLRRGSEWRRLVADMAAQHARGMQRRHAQLERRTPASYQETTPAVGLSMALSMVVVVVAASPSASPPAAATGSTTIANSLRRRQGMVYGLRYADGHVWR